MPEKPPESPPINLIRREYLPWLNRADPNYQLILAAWKDPRNQQQGYSTIEQMLMDARVQQAVNMVKAAVASLGYSIEGELPEAQLKEVRDFVAWNLNSQQGPLDEALDHLMSCFEYGYSLTAIRWGSSPAWKRRWVIERLIPLPPQLYRPRVEADGSVSGVVGPDATFDDPRSYIYLRWNPKFGSPYGRSQLFAAYEAWWNKSTLRRMRNLTLDRFGAPFITVRVPPTTDPKKRQELADTIRDFHAHGGAVLDDTDRIELLTASGGAGSAEYQRALEFENLEILAAICGATLNASQSNTGSYAQAKVHQEMFLYQVQRLADTLEAALNEQLLRPLLEYNYGPQVANAVWISWGNVQVKGKDILEMVTQLVPIGVVQPDEPWIRERLDIPAPEGQDQAAGPAQQDWSAGNNWADLFAQAQEDAQRAYTEGLRFEEPPDT